MEAPNPQKTEKHSHKYVTLPLAFTVAMLGLWYVLSAARVFPETAFPSPYQVAMGFEEEARGGGLFDHIIASLFRVGAGFGLAVGLGVPLGLVMGMRLNARLTLLPAVNFFRALSPLAWIPFAITWFGIGDVPATFLIFMSAFFPVALSTVAAVASIPAVYFQVARDYNFKGLELLTKVTLPAIMPSTITALRVASGVSWLVVVAAEMVAGRDGLGYLIWDSRNLLRPDLVVVGMVIIGVIGVLLDRLLSQLTRIPSVQWGYGR